MSRRGEHGVMLVDLLTALALLAIIGGAFYAPLILLLRGTTALHGQLETQQQPRVALERVVNDLRQASDYTVSVGPPLRLAITKVT
ncbi:MAG: hypothetical protein HY334_00805, partial [Armatimonadetes bacterium]|nr:hypothetical protein [Armatimonadota bacterium]